MSKRFIDTGIFDDEWFMELSKDGKVLWLYFITKCDHAGIIKLNEKLCRVQTDIKDLNAAIEQLSSRLVTVAEQLYFIPKFVEFQYPGFPNCGFNMAKSAIAILEKHGLIKDSCLTVHEQLTNCTGNGNGIINGNGNSIKGGSGGKNKYHNVPPQISEVSERILERGINTFTAESFFAFYESKGWKVGGAKMTNWDAALTTWDVREKNKKHENTSGTGKRNTKRVNDYWNTPGGVPAV